MTENHTRADRAWALWALVPLLLGGIGASVYMSRHHETQLYGGAAYQGEALVGCAEAEGVNCDIVNTSAWSELFGVGLFTWAVPFYVLAILLAVRGARGDRPSRALLTALGVGATLFSVFLFYISKVELGYVCLWCMRLYVLNAAMLAAPLVAGVRRSDLPLLADLGLPAATYGAAAAVAIGGQLLYREQLKVESGAVEIAQVADVETVGFQKDPTGDAPTLSFDVTTEDGNPAKVTVHPGDAWKGNPAAKVAIVEYGDFECGYCKRAGFELRRIYEHYKDDVVFVFKHFPMDPACNPGVKNKKHAEACQAALASSCAQQQGSFWAMHDLMYKNNHQLRSEHLLAYAEKIGLHKDQFIACMREGKGKDDVVADATEGQALEIHGTPRIWINGQLYRAGQSAEQMAAAIEKELGRTGADAAAGISSLREQGAARPTAIPDGVPEMQKIEAGGLKFMIDTFEAAIVDGKAVSGKHNVPAIRSSFFSAKAACEAAGKQLCTEAQWIAACQGAAPVDDNSNGQVADDLIEGTAYPYGDFHEPGRCWEAKVNPKLEPGQSPPFRPVYTGEMPACVSPAGVYDLTGNMEEWVGTSPETAVLLGGAFDTPDDKARCYRRNDTFGAGYANVRTGFRCCKPL
jgi:protein-disulfide isomerase